MFTLFGSKFTKLAVGLVLLFTIVEILTLVYWLVFALRPGTTNHVVAVVILAIGLTIEHFLSAATGTHISAVDKNPAEN
jgi:cobalamin biosynthesis protein CobD/CbiB